MEEHDKNDKEETRTAGTEADSGWAMKRHRRESICKTSLPSYKVSFPFVLVSLLAFFFFRGPFMKCLSAIILEVHAARSSEGKRKNTVFIAKNFVGTNLIAFLVVRFLYLKWPKTRNTFLQRVDPTQG